MGNVMSATQDHTLSPAHGHLNLIGFVVMIVFGTFYALTPSAAATRLASIHYFLALAAVVMAISGSGEVLAKIGSVLTLAAMALFAFLVMRHGVGSRALNSTP